MYSGITSHEANSWPNTDETIAQIKAQEYTYTRCSFISAPNKKADFKKTKIPFVISSTILPQNEQEVKRVESIPRCVHCKAYLNTYSEIIPPGYKWRCSICRSINDSATPLHSYGGSLRVFSPSENTENNKRVSNNPILTESIIEFISPAEKATPPPASLVFIIECTKESVDRGVFSAVLEEIGETLKYLNDPHERGTICIILLSSSVELVRLNESELIVDKVNEIEGSLPMLMEPEYTARIATFKSKEAHLADKIRQIKEYAINTYREPGNVFGLSLKVLSQVVNRRAEVFAFLVTQPSIGPGSIVKAQSDLGHLSVGKDTFYSDTAHTLCESNVAVNLYVLASMKIEVPVLLPLVRKTGGYIRYYPAYIGNYTHDRNALKLDLMQHLSLDNGSNAYCRVRVSNEVSIKKYWGVDVYNDGLIKLPRLGRGKTFSFELEYDEDLVLEGITVQIASIFNNAKGERVIRVINFVVGLGPTAIDLQGLVHAIALKGLDVEVAQKISGVKTILEMATEAMGCIGLQGMMSVFPILIHGLVKNKVFSKTVSSDLKGVIYLGITDEPMKVVDAIIYPMLVRLDGIETEVDSQDEIVLPLPVRLSGSMIGSDGAYYLDCGIIAYVFIGSNSKYRVFEDVQGRTSMCLEGLNKGKEKPIRNIMDYMLDGRVSDPVMYVVQQNGPAFLLEGMQTMLLDDGKSPVSLTFNEYYSKFISKGYIK